MKRALITQMSHEWRTNLWLIIELLIVSFVVAIVAYVTLLSARPMFEPVGFDDTDVYALKVKYVGEESPEYVSPGDNESMNYDDLMTLITRLRRHPLVEAVAQSRNAVPYTMNYFGSGLVPKGSNDSILYYGNQRFASPDFVRVYRIKGVDGTSTEELEARLRRSEILLGTNLAYDDKRDTRKLSGIEVVTPGDSASSWKVAGIIDNFKRSPYELNYSGTIFRPVDESKPWNCYQIVLRLRPGEGRKFAEQFNSNADLQRQRNVYLTELTSLKTMRKLVTRHEDQELRTCISIMIFFLVIVFLGLLGSFWFRVQARASEIALRKVTGATRADVFRRLISEGTLLLAVGYVVGMILYFLFMLKAKDHIGRDWPRAYVAAGVTFVIMEIMVILGIWFPARRAMEIEPSEVLKEE